MREVKTEVTMFACEICEAVYPKKKAAHRCERQHRALTCQHKNITFRVKKSKEKYDNGAILLIKECSDCITYHELELSGLSSESLGKLWPVVHELFAFQKQAAAAVEELNRDPNGKALMEIFGEPI